MSYFSGPSTPQMRLTVFLLGAALFCFGWFVGTRDTLGSALNDYGQVIEANCGTPLDPGRSSNFFPALAESCSAAALPGRYLAIACLILGAILLIRLLYMLIGPKAPSAQQ
ncbi:MAG TPA: hypothetical protein VF885_24455 [Arthrobacter sp.]